MKTYCNHAWAGYITYTANTAQNNNTESNTFAEIPITAKKEWRVRACVRVCMYSRVFIQQVVLALLSKAPA